MIDIAGLHVVDEGAREALPLVFLHAFPLHSAMWDGQRAALAGQARCIAFDVRGLGPSAPVGHAYMLEHIVDDLFTVLDALQIESALLCGLSMGGYVALRAVEREPQRVRGLLLADAQSAADTDAAKLARADGVRMLTRDGVEPFVEAQLKRLLCKQTLEQKPGLVAEVRSMMLAADAEGIASSLVALATRTDVTASLGRIAVPTRVIVGKEDAVTPPAAAQALAAAILGADLHVLEGAGHLANLEAPEAFNRLLLEQLARVRG